MVLISCRALTAADLEAFIRDPRYKGTAAATRIPMMARTTASSTSVKPPVHRPRPARRRDRTPPSFRTVSGFADRDPYVHDRRRRDCEGHTGLRWDRRTWESLTPSFHEG